jgi:cytoskeletal protein RodZ
LYLAGQRRLRGISVEELAVRTRIPRRNIERLEAGAFDRAPDGFSRGFVRTIAEALGLDPDEAVMRLMSEPAADDLEGARSRRITLGLRVAALAVVLVVIVLAGRFAVVALAPGEAEDSETEVFYRTDAVRSLAEAVPTPATEVPLEEASDVAEPADR